MVNETHANGFRKDTSTRCVGQSPLLEVLEALKAAEVDDRIRQAAETICQGTARLHNHGDHAVQHRGEARPSPIGSPAHLLFRLAGPQRSAARHRSTLIGCWWTKFRARTILPRVGMAPRKRPVGRLREPGKPVLTATRIEKSPSPRSPRRWEPPEENTFRGTETVWAARGW
jgi:hypothetical protein